MPGLLQNRSQMPSTAYASNGARLVSPTGEALALRSISLTADAMGGIARTRLRQHFANQHRTPLELTYAFPLPADGAVAGYEIHAGSRVIKGRVEAREKARAEFESARLEGRTAGLVDEERANFFTQRLGNIPAGTDVMVELTIDHPLAWIPGGAWEWRFPTVVAPRYLGARGVVPDASAVTVDVVDGATTPVASVSIAIADDLTSTPTSPSHTISTANGTVTLASDAPLDRDIVVRWAAARPAPGLTLRRARPASGKTSDPDVAYGLLTIVPPAGARQAVARDLVLLLDVSGSMSGKPLDQLKEVVIGLIESLGDHDRLEMVAFASGQERYRKVPVQATERERRQARAWIDALTAGGGTEMISAIAAALRPLREDATRQVVIVTDGQIGFEAGAIRAIRDGLPKGSRLHTVGVGSATNRAFLHPAARAGRGVEVMIGLDEPAAPGAERILAATRDPEVVDVTVRGTALLDAPPRLPDLLAGSPVLTGIRLRPEGGTLIVSGRAPQGTWEERLDVPATQPGEGSEALGALWAREAIGDLELDLACGASRSTVDPRIEAIALRHAIASRLTSWIAVAEEPSVDPREPVRVERIPQALPYGMSAEGLGLHKGIADTASFLLASPPPAMARRPALERSAPIARLQGEDAEPPLEHARRTAHRELARLRELARSLEELVEHLLRRLRRLKALTTLQLALRGRVLPTPGRPTTTIEIFMTSDLDWEPAGTATVANRTVDVIEAGTTRPGEISAGSLVRVELSATADQVARSGQVEIQNGMTKLAVTLNEVD